jgi:hypothetical protein
MKLVTPSESARKAEAVAMKNAPFENGSKTGNKVKENALPTRKVREFAIEDLKEGMGRAGPW